MSDNTAHLNQYQAVIGLHFLNPTLLQRALTHRSFANEAEATIRDNERLEFLGDAILDFIVADMLFRRFPDTPEGELTQLRAALVRTESLAILARDIRLGDFLLIGKGEERSGGRERTNNLCRGYEALIGSIYLDRGLEATREFCLPALGILLDYVIENDLHKDARSMLQELSQADLRITPTYRLKETTGPDHDREFVLEVLIAGVAIGDGVGTSKRIAAQNAARSCLKQIETQGWSDSVRRAASAYHLIEAAELERDTLAATLHDPKNPVTVLKIVSKKRRT